MEAEANVNPQALNLNPVKVLPPKSTTAHSHLYALIELGPAFQAARGCPTPNRLPSTLMRFRVFRIPRVFQDLGSRVVFSTGKLTIGLVRSGCCRAKNVAWPLLCGVFSRCVDEYWCESVGF